MAKRLGSDLFSLEGLALIVGALMLAAVLYDLTFGMSDTAVVALGGTAYILLMLSSGWCLFEGLATDRVRVQFWRPSRAEHPLDYWIGIAMWGGIFAATVFFAVLIAMAIAPELAGR